MKVVTFGEIMMRLMPPGYDRFCQTTSFNATYAGAEANVAVSLALLGAEAEFVSKVPCHEIGQNAVNELRRWGVGVKYVLRGGDRLGVYYAENGASQRPGKIIYDRANSAFALSNPDEYDWNALLSGADAFFFTGIDPALGENVSRACVDALRTAKKLGVKVFCDLNYRSKLWSKERAREVMTPMMKYVDVLLSNPPQISDVLGERAESDEKLFGLLCDKYGFEAVAFTGRDSKSASVNGYYGRLYTGGKTYSSRYYEINIVDRIGGGDAFSAALIYEMLSGVPAGECVEFATAAAVLCHSVTGDFNLVSKDEIGLLATGDGSGRVIR